MKLIACLSGSAFLWKVVLLQLHPVSPTRGNRVNTEQKEQCVRSCSKIIFASMAGNLAMLIGNDCYKDQESMTVQSSIDSELITSTSG